MGAASAQQLMHQYYSSPRSAVCMLRISRLWGVRLAVIIAVAQLGPHAAKAQTAVPEFTILSDLDVNPATAYPTGFVLADDIPSTFRFFAPGTRHTLLLNPARMVGSNGFIVSQYLPNGNGDQQVGVHLVTGGENSWLVSVAGSRSTIEQSSTETRAASLEQLDVETTNLGSATNATLRLARSFVANPASSLKGAVGLRFGLQRQDEERTSLSAGSTTDVTNLLNATRYRVRSTDENAVGITDNTVLRAGIEAGIANERTDALLAMQLNYVSADWTDERFVQRTDVDSLVASDQTLTLYDRTHQLSDERSTESQDIPGFSAGLAIRHTIAERGAARHSIVIQGGANFGPGSKDRTEFTRSELEDLQIQNGLIVVDESSKDSVSTESSGKPVRRTIFAQGAYIHQQSVGKVEITTGLAATTLFGLARSGKTLHPEERSSRIVDNSINWLVPAFISYKLTRSVSLFAGAVFDLSYTWTKSQAQVGNPLYSVARTENRTGEMVASYRVGAMIDQAGYYGQVRFAGNLTDYSLWEVSLGLDL